MRYLVSVCASAGVVVLTEASRSSVIARLSPVALVAVVMASAWFGGFGPGVLAAFVVVGTSDLLGVGTPPPLQSRTADVAIILLLIGSAFALTSIRSARRRAGASGRSESGRPNTNWAHSTEAATVLNSLSDIAIAAVDRRLRFVYANDEACRQLHCGAGEIIGKTVFQVVAETENADWFNQLARSMGRQSASRFEAFVNPLNGWFDFRCYPSSQGLVFSFSDVSEAKREHALKPLPLWNDDIEFLQLVNAIEYTLVDRARCYVLFQLAKLTANLIGDVAEVGVYRGGTARLLALAFDTRAKKQLHLFDTFEGMPSTDTTVDHHHKGDFADTSLESVQRQFTDCGDVRFYKGVFPDTAGPIENCRFCMVHVDADIYQSVKDSCTFFYPRLEKGGVMVFDDYGFSSCPGARKAVDEFFADKEELPFYLPSGQCFIMKRT